MGNGAGQAECPAALRPHTTRILCVAKDAGGSSVVGPVLKRLRERGEDLLVLAAEPAARLLRRLVGPSELEALSRDTGEAYHRIESALDEWHPHALLLGTGHPNSPDQWAAVLARQREIPSLAVLDSWCNYELRFSGPSTRERWRYLPDLIAVMDEQARAELIRLGVDERQVIVTGHPGLDEIPELIQAGPRLREKVSRRLEVDSESCWILFISENGEEVYAEFPDLHLGYTEVDVFRMLYPVVRSLPAQSRLTFIVRRHPGEFLPKYPSEAGVPSWMRYDESGENPRELVLSADIVVGISSTLLLEAYLMSKRVISVQPCMKGEDPFILTRMGLVPLVRNREELEIALIEALQPVLARCSSAENAWMEFLLDGRATARVVHALESLQGMRGRLRGASDRVI